MKLSIYSVISLGLDEEDVIQDFGGWLGARKTERIKV
jgi:hypothetical protein